MKPLFSATRYNGIAGFFSIPAILFFFLSRSHCDTFMPNSRLNRSRNTVFDMWHFFASSSPVIFAVTRKRTVSLKPAPLKSGIYFSARRKSDSVMKESFVFMCRLNSLMTFPAIRLYRKFRCGYSSSGLIA